MDNNSRLPSFRPDSSGGTDDSHFAPPALPSDESEFRADPKNDLIILPEGATRADAVYYASQRIPMNEFGLPTWFYRSDLIHDLGHLRQADLDSAAEGLFYPDGYPVTQYGSSFWQQLPHEPFTQFNYFSKFLEQAFILGIRQLDVLSGELGIDLPQLQQVYREFYWSSRARAYDLFITAAEAKKREYRIRSMENDHFIEAGGLLAKLKERFQGENGEWIEELSAKEAIEVMETLVKIQRLSVGLTGQHASSNVGQPGRVGASAEFILRQITKSAGMSDANSDQFQHKLQDLLADPEQGMKLQELIFRVNTTDFEHGAAM
jgi:hypothetical protein